ncbi:hypothetical protein [Schumannella soli]|uniref:Uncharacterized protein n=1 Tax=Schumannella soli TaxID=2590779 RepID=A0A506XYQ6_9MICO|nr:hypothetical protein [Schumannella soli]TPW78074.1 hypothetical protein FJ657_05455 [Schumannella soli]
MIASAEHIQSFQQPTSSTDCEPLSAAEVRAAPVAFAATANHIEHDTVALKVTSRYAGITAEHVQVPQGNGAAEIRFRTGKHYLLAAEDERILGCGISGEATEEQRALYIQAFG